MLVFKVSSFKKGRKALKIFDLLRVCCQHGFFTHKMGAMFKMSSQRTLMYLELILTDTVAVNLPLINLYFFSRATEQICRLSPMFTYEA